ncbi:MAG: hypothetical protein HYS12_02265 [Planctomycetes bacterium]|nr:hypothetical protein [Planctomycetota bacterium]
MNEHGMWPGAQALRSCAAEEFAEQLPRLWELVEIDLKALEKTLDEAGIPPTPGRLPEWKEK